MPQDLVKCPLCERHVSLQPRTSAQWDSLEKSVEANAYPHGHDVELAPDLRLVDELDLSL